MRERQALPIRMLVAVVVLTAASLALLARQSHETGRGIAIVHARPSVTVAEIAP